MIGSAVLALQRIGAPAVPVCLRFLRNSFHARACFAVARALGVAGRGSSEVFDYLLGQFEQTPAGKGKVGWAMPLALMHDTRAVEPLARGLEATRDEADEDIREIEAIDYLDALDELGAISSFIRPAGEADQHDEPVWASVELRGVGLVGEVAPAGWVPPAERAELEEDEWQDEDDDEDDDDDDTSLFLPDTDRSPFSYMPPAPMRQYVNADKVGRNDPCPYGSGKKYKHCHGKPQ